MAIKVKVIENVKCIEIHPIMKNMRCFSWSGPNVINRIWTRAPNTQVGDIGQLQCSYTKGGYGQWIFQKNTIPIPAVTDPYAVVVIHGDHEEAICKCDSKDPVDVLYALATKLGYMISVHKESTVVTNDD